jgi:hypothetical protein
MKRMAKNEDKNTRFCFWMDDEQHQLFINITPRGMRDAIYKNFMSKIMALANTKSQPDHLMLDIAKGNYDLVIRQPLPEAKE